ncbi:hypothetical protein ABZU76_47260 [Amycolatopsis sp. NPDC005232]|uniref:hypothetical protein n=1 Tax=Amycolatopsis sp. NPDC005232 TaxID=3157027 RepID=UPI0033AB50AA
MITLKFLSTWLKIATIAALVFVIEIAVIHSFWLFVLVAVPTVLIFAVLTGALWREWRTARRGDGAYSVQYIRYEQD